MADSELELGIKVTGKGIDKATDELNALAKAGEKAEEKVKGVGKGAKGSVAPMKNLRAQAQQASYQFQDIAVQAQMGTSAFTIIGQQGSQLASVFGPAGAVTGALIAFGAIIGGFLFDSMNKTGKAMSDLEEDMKTLVERFDDLTEAEKAYVRTLVTKDIEDQTAAIAELNKEIAAGQRTRINAKGYGPTIKDAEDAETYAKRLEVLNAKLAGLKTSREENRKSIDDTTNSTETLLEKLQDEVDTLGMSRREVDLHNIGLDKSQKANRKLTNELYDAIEAEEKRIELKKESEKLDDKIAANELAMARFFRDKTAAKEKEAAADAKALDSQKIAAEARLLQITQSAMDESALLDSILNENATKLAEDYANKLINEEQFLIGMKALNEKYSKDGVALATAEAQAKTDIQQQVISSMSGIAGQLSGIAAEGSKEAKVLFAMQKALAIAQIIVSTEVAAQAAGAQAAILAGPLGYFATAAGIRAVGYASAGIVAGTAIAGGRALGGQVRGGESYLVGERGPELLTMGSSGRIATNENLKKAVGSESGQSQANVSVNFSIQANDTAGFDRLLNSRRGQIVSMINHAVNNRGRASIT